MVSLFGRLRALWRMLALALVFVAGLLTEILIFPLVSQAGRDTCIRIWAVCTLRALGIRLEVHGEAPKQAAMIAANHASWLDIIVINAAKASQFVAKSEIRSWPLVGTLAARAGTHFIERARRHAVHAVIQALSAAMKQGHTVGVFPEGTTNDGTFLKPFHANLMQAAIDAQVPIVPLAIRYLEDDGGWASATEYVGDTTFVDSLKRVLHSAGFRAELHWGEAIAPDGRRHDLCHQAEEAVSRLSGLPKSEPQRSPRPGT